MKRQYFGDSKDSFKWDYLDHLTRSLRLPMLQIGWMMTPDDSTSDGKTSPEQFPAREGTLELCKSLRRLREPSLVRQLPSLSDNRYDALLDSWPGHFNNRERNEYFCEFSCKHDQALFLDHDNGFEPEKNYNEKHVRYQEVRDTLSQASPRSVITIFQHHRRKNFVEDYARINERLDFGYSTALFWHSVMFVTVAKSDAIRALVRQSNSSYAESHPVKTVG
ncbi:MAG: hypothetical protein FJY56_06605 [Betaproteobacteria bacterium]|nr:hypothetical protein [Betaproteobacteria bacterium]